MDFRIFKTVQADDWLETLNMCSRYDFYHCPAYHEIATRNTSDEANLLAYHEGGYTIAIPLVIRPVNEIECLSAFDCNDATSVYGYAGPVASHDTIPGSIIRNFQGNLMEYFRDNNIISVFSRLHPLIDQQPLLEGFGDIVHIGQTVSIDLRSPIDEQFSHYRRNHKKNISSLRQLGVCCMIDRSAEHLEDFVDMYHENMKRVNAQEEYFFDKAYFRGLLSAKGFDMYLFTCFLDDEMACGGVFSLCNGIVQAWLMCTRDKYLKLAPMKLLIDEVRIWANEVGASFFHLGGGLGAGEDSLFRFKTGFSNTRHRFCVWQLVVMEKRYMEICGEKALCNELGNLETTNSNYFPVYRCPTT